MCVRDLIDQLSLKLYLEIPVELFESNVEIALLSFIKINIKKKNTYSLGKHV